MVDDHEAAVAAVRRFNRFYTQKIGVLHEGLLDSPYTLTEARVLYELAQLERSTAGDLGRLLSLDAGYLSRILARFAAAGLVLRRRSAEDARRTLLTLTAKGRKAYAMLDGRSRREIGAVLRELGPAQKTRLLGGIDVVGAALGSAPPVDQGSEFVLRAHKPGDLGWVIGRHGALYAGEYGWDIGFEAFVAEIAAKFLRDFDPATERSWIAERGGEIVGSVFLVRQSAHVAKLRMLLVDPSARGLGLGERLVAVCIDAARTLGYRKLTLWTNDVLVAARRIYEKAGFTLVKRERHVSFGKRLVGEFWELDLRAPVGDARGR